MSDDEESTRQIEPPSPADPAAEESTRQLTTDAPPAESGTGWKTRVIDAKTKVSSLIQKGSQQLQSGGLAGGLAGGLKDKLDLKKIDFKNLDPARISEWTVATMQGQGVSFYGKALTFVLCAYFLADLSSLMIGRFIPEPPPASLSLANNGFRKPKTLEDYGPIFARNLFSSKGIIPGEEVPTGGAVDPGGAPVRTTLPFNLIGTVIFQDEFKSIATIEDKSASLVYPVRSTDEIPSKAKILTIEPRRVIFVNLSSNRKEFVDLPEDSTANPRITLGSAKGSGAPGIEKTSPNTFNIARGEVDKALGDLNNILTQARAVPHFENGQPAGYKLFQIVPGSIYDKLGLQNGDVIAGFDGQPITDPGKAFEALGNLRNTPHLEIQIKRDGKASTMAYDIR